MTKRFVFLIAFGIPLVCVGAFFSLNAAGTIFIIYNGLILALYLMDLFITPKSEVIEIERFEYDKLYFKSMDFIGFIVENKFSRKLNIELKDEIADWHFEIVSTDMKNWVEPGKKADFGYIVIPKKRGNFLFPNVHVRYDGVLGLCKKYFITPLAKDYKVYPNLRNLSKYRLIIQKNRLLTQGNRRVSIKGFGHEFESLKEYVEGDDYRKINWMATARENKLIVNQFEAEKNQPVYILLDTGRSMSYSIKGYKKLDYSINAALILSDIVNQKGDNSGLLVFNNDVQSLIPPGKGEQHRNAFMEELYHAEDTNMSSDYLTAFMELVNKQKRRSIVFIFTDFETTEEAKELLEAIPILSKRHVPVVALMVNESLVKIAKDEQIGTREIFNSAMAESLIAERRGIIRSLNHRGIICMETYAENFAIETVNRYLMLKERFSG